MKKTLIILISLTLSISNYAQDAKSENIRKFVRLNDKCGFLDSGNKVVIPLIYDDAWGFNESCCAPVQLDGKWGFIDINGTETIPFRYDNAGEFCSGRAAVELNSKWGFIDANGNEIIPLKYDAVSAFGEGRAAVRINGKYGFIDTEGKEVIPLKYSSAGLFFEGRAVINLNNRYGYIDTTGKEIIPPKYYNAHMYFCEGRTAVQLKLNGKWAFIDLNGKQITPFIYDEPMTFTDGRALVTSDGKYGFINLEGKLVIPLKYKSANSFGEGYAAVEQNGKYGFIDLDGNPAIPFKYDYAEEFRNGIARVILGDKRGYIDIEGNEIIPPKYDKSYNFYHGIASVELDGREFYIDTAGNEIEMTSEETETEFDMMDFYNSNAADDFYSRLNSGQPLPGDLQTLEYLQRFIRDTLVINKTFNNKNGVNRLEIEVINPCREPRNIEEFNSEDSWKYYRYDGVINYIVVRLTNKNYSDTLVYYHPGVLMNLINPLERNITLKTISGRQAVFIPFAYCGTQDPERIQISCIILYNRQKYIYHNIDLHVYDADLENYKVFDDLNEKFKDLPKKLKKELIKYFNSQNKTAVWYERHDWEDLLE
jgi:hypothetical protein